MTTGDASVGAEGLDTPGSGVVLTYLARQPIFDRDTRLVGYELLYRAGDVEEAGVVDQAAATLNVLGGAFMDFGLDALVGGHRAFINVPRSFFDDGTYRLIASDRFVLELLEDAAADDVLLAALARARAEGYTVALDDFTGEEAGWSLVRQAEIVKVDLQQLSAEQVADQLHRLKAAGVTVLAEKVETPADYERCLALGFDLFQGFYFARPMLFQRATLSPDRLAATRLLVELHRPGTDVRDIAEVIRRDAGLSYRLLTIVNSSYYGLRHRVDSIPQAVMLLGMDAVRNYAALLALMDVRARTPELVNTAMVRARMCELLAPSGAGNARNDRDAAFTVGLLSLLDAVMEVPLAELLERLPLSERVEGALLERSGALGGLLSLVESYERDETFDTDIPASHLSSTYLEAVAWTADIHSLLATGNTPK